MLIPLLLLFTLVPLLELALLIKIGRLIDVGPTIGLVVITGIIGAWLARHEGLRTLTRIRSELSAGQLPGNEMIDALLILVAGVFLVTPGVVTDGIGFLLLIPPVRALMRNYLKARFKAKFVMTHMSNTDWSRQDDFIDVEVKSLDDEQ